jgi:hypothetical protein
MKFQKFRFLLVVAIAFTACKNETSNTPEVIVVNTNEVKNLDVSVRADVVFKDEKITEAFKFYNGIRASLVNTNATDAAKFADSLYQLEIRKAVNAETAKALQLIADGKDIVEQRKHFVTVTKTIEILVAGTIESGALYKQYCPMAFGNTGAYWLSDSKEIRNPYFGDKMLKCGRVDEEIK